MKKILLLILALSFLPIIDSFECIKAQTEFTSDFKGKKTVKVKSYKKKDGTKVKEHKRSQPKRK